jgi:hypothetical protein
MTTQSTRTIRIATAIAFASLLSACASLVPTESGAGYIAEVDPAQVRICFRSGVLPGPGQEVHFISDAHTARPSYRSMRAIGAARIETMASDGCAKAVALTGVPQLGDEVYFSNAHRD